ncbi:MAG TPA: M28 family metallopeptidase [Cryomorphaceae bacterium]|nr:M28 family metallopeptidase [Cryomorphaceae bacterium]
MRNLLGFLSIALVVQAYGQNLDQVKSDVDRLASPQFAGRGYVENGLGKASVFLQKRLTEIGLESTTQSYGFAVNTFPKASTLKVGKQKLKEGVDFIIDPRSGTFSGKLTIVRLDSASLLASEIPDLPEGSIPVIDTEGIDTPDEVTVQYDFVQSALKRGPVILLKNKLTWSVGEQLYANPIIEVLTSSFPEGEEKLTVKTKPTQVDFTAQNIITKIQGKSSDSLLVFTAHYDHLGMMGDALFAGASDNATGTATLLDLATYYADHQPEYDTYFIFFSGEEAGLIGSRYFVEYPTFDLNKVKFLINLDLMGSAEKGITIVNGRLHQERMAAMAAINTERDLVPKIKLRGKAANSDHYWFSEKGVPAIFIYTVGNITAYHDIYDLPNVVDWSNYQEVFTLLVEFVKTL